jgi:thiol:disulfide interchange protein DsbD
MGDFLRGLEGYIQASPFLAFLAVFVGGILVSFTPCVYPIIPITIGVIGTTGAGSKTKGFLLSLFYVLGIATMYAALGAFAAISGRLFGEIGSSPYSYLIVGNICIILALMLFEVVPFRMPGLITKVSVHKPEKKGFFTAYVMGLISGIIVGPCTAAPLGVVLTFVATKQNVLYGITLLFAFALGMGMILIIVGTFAGLLAALPKPGPWMDRVRKGFAWLFLIMGEVLLIKAGSLWM